MSRGPQVLDMEYREQDLPEHGPGGPILFFFHHLYLVSSRSIHHHRLGPVSKEVLAPWGNWYKYHGTCHFWSLKHLNICIWFLLSLTTAWILHWPTWPWLGELTGCPSKPVPIGFGLPLGNFWRAIVRSHHSTTVSSCLLLIYPIPLVRALGWPICRIAPYLVGRRG